MATDRDEPKGSTPVPDPTLLTTQQLLGAVESLKELMRAEIHGRAELVDAKFEALARATDEKLVNLDRLHNEKFASVQTQFSERDTRVEQTSRDTKTAVDAALMAAEKAVNKQTETFSQSINKAEAATTKQIDQMGLLIQTTVAGLNDKIDDAKQRLTRIEGGAVGHKDTVTATMAIVGILIALAGLVFGYGLFRSAAPPQTSHEIIYVPTPTVTVPQPQPVPPK